MSFKRFPSTRFSKVSIMSSRSFAPYSLTASIYLHGKHKYFFNVILLSYGNSPTKKSPALAAEDYFSRPARKDYSSSSSIMARNLSNTAWEISSSSTET